MYTDLINSLRVQAHENFLIHVAKLTKLGDAHRIDDLVNSFVLCFGDLPPFSGYKHVPASAREIHSQVQARFGAQNAREFLYACILQSVRNSLISGSFAHLPERIKGHQLKQFRRIIEQASPITAICELDNDLFQKEMGLALTRLYAAAAQLVDFRTGIGRSMLTRSGVRGLPGRLSVFAKLGGFKPLFEIHTHLSYLDEFNEEGWNECYRCCADLYAVHPKVLGMQGGSWFYDPALADISPRLGYLRDVPQQGGAWLLFTSSGEQSVHDATSTSPTRKKLYDEGKYQPKNYTLIWSRATQLNWAKTVDLNTKSV